MQTRFLIVASLAVALGAGGYLFYGSAFDAQHGINPADMGQVALGNQIYDRECASCHGQNLEGQTPDWRRRLPNGRFPAPPHDASGHTWHHPDEILFEITKYGRLRDARASAPSDMPAFESKLSDREIWAVLSYIKNRWPPEIAQRHDAINQRYRSAR